MEATKIHFGQNASQMKKSQHCILRQNAHFCMNFLDLCVYNWDPSFSPIKVLQLSYRNQCLVYFLEFFSSLCKLPKYPIWPVIALHQAHEPYFISSHKAYQWGPSCVIWLFGKLCMLSCWIHPLLALNSLFMCLL